MDVIEGKTVVSLAEDAPEAREGSIYGVISGMLPKTLDELKESIAGKTDVFVRPTTGEPASRNLIYSTVKRRAQRGEFILDPAVPKIAEEAKSFKEQRAAKAAERKAKAEKRKAEAEAKEKAEQEAAASGDAEGTDGKEAE